MDPNLVPLLDEMQKRISDVIRKGFEENNFKWEKRVCESERLQGDRCLLPPGPSAAPLPSSPAPTTAAPGLCVGQPGAPPPSSPPTAPTAASPTSPATADATTTYIDPIIVNTLGEMEAYVIVTDDDSDDSPTRCSTECFHSAINKLQCAPNNYDLGASHVDAFVTSCIPELSSIDGMTTSANKPHVDFPKRFPVARVNAVVVPDNSPSVESVTPNNSPSRCSLQIQNSSYECSLNHEYSHRYIIYNHAPLVCRAFRVHSAHGVFEKFSGQLAVSLLVDFAEIVPWPPPVRIVQYRVTEDTSQL